MTLTHSAVSYKNTDGSHMETANRLLSHSQLPLYFWNIWLQVLGKYEFIHKLYSQWHASPWTRTLPSKSLHWCEYIIRLIETITIVFERCCPYYTVFVHHVKFHVTSTIPIQRAGSSIAVDRSLDRNNDCGGDVSTNHTPHSSSSTNQYAMCECYYHSISSNHHRQPLRA